MLKFTRGNAKLSKDIYSFSLPSGFTCPGAKDCLSFANRKTGKIKDGPNTEFRCFSASQEALLPNVRRARWHNMELLKGKSRAEMVVLILEALPKKAKIVRIHVAGDFFSQDYFNAWMDVAAQNPDILFYAYTKSLHFWQNAESIPSNMKLNASKGGSYDKFIETHNLKYAEVVYSQYEARKKKLKIDHTDEMAFKQGKSFALLIHNTQPKGTKAAKAWQRVKNTVGGYKRA